VSDLQTLLSRNDVTAHLVGCGGAGMRALAEYAADRGWRLSGCDAGLNDRTRARLEAVGVQTAGGHSPEHIGEHCELVVHTPAVLESHSEIAAALRRGLAVASYPQFLGAVSRQLPTIAVSGTHGKSTTTGLIACALSEAGEAAAVFCGAEILSKGRHGWAGPGGWGVVEACEYRRHFLELRPEIGIILAVEEDHFDCFDSLADVSRAYVDFASRVQRLALIHVDSAAGREVARQAVSGGCTVETMSWRGAAADWQASGIRQREQSIEFDVLYQGRTEERISTPLLGDHHAANMLAAYAALRAAGVSRDAIVRSLSGFSGLGRRLERHRDWRGATRYDDYAHHPTAVRATLKALRELPGVGAGRRLVSLFQPHQISRTERLAAEFGDSLSLADEAWVLPVYAAREAGLERAEMLARDVARHVKTPCESHFIPSLDHALSRLETALRPGDVFVTLGAGDIDCLQYELPRRFP